jgi:DNA-binding NarL/FixJ family response regulator
MIWQIDLALAALYQDQGQEAAARDALSSAQKQVDAIAGSVTDAGLRDQFIRYASSRMPDVDGMGSNTADTVTSSEPHPPAGLTAREVEVLRLVAQGATNRDIASTLTISERTVNTHLTNIYNKIDAKNRTAAAAYALQRGLA